MVVVTVDPEIDRRQTVATVTVPAFAANTLIGFANNSASVNEGEFCSVLLSWQA